MKKCTKCNELKSRLEFSKRPASKDGLNMWCKDCVRINNKTYKDLNREKVRAASREYWRSNPDKVQNKELKHKYGITKAAYDRLLAKQDGVCAICSEPELSKHRDGKIRRLAVDHDHETNKIRGLLCNRCNKGLGIFEDDTLLLWSAYGYLGGTI